MSYGVTRETFTKTVTGEALIFSQNVLNVEFITIEATATGSPLTSFTLQMRGHPASVYSDIASQATDYTNPMGIIRGASCDMTTLSAEGWVMIDVRGLSDIKLKASSAGSTELTVRVGG